MLQIRNRYNRQGEIIEPGSYQAQHAAALEEFLSEMYAEMTEKGQKQEISTGNLSSVTG